MSYASNLTNYWDNRQIKFLHLFANLLKASLGHSPFYEAHRTQTITAYELPIHVAEVAETLDSTPAMHPICGQIGTNPKQPNRAWRLFYGALRTQTITAYELPIQVAEAAETLDSTPAMHPICGQIGYQSKATQ